MIISCAFKTMLFRPFCTVALTCNLSFQTPPVTEFPTCETAIFYLSQNSLPNNLQCCSRHKIYLLINSHQLSHTGFVPSHENSCNARENPHTLENASYYGGDTPRNLVIHRTLPKTRFNVLYNISNHPPIKRVCKCSQG